MFEAARGSLELEPMALSGIHEGHCEKSKEKEKEKKYTIALVYQGDMEW
jgi:hypothetical protein